MFGSELRDTDLVERLDEAGRIVERVLAEVEPDRISGEAAELLIRRFTRIERLAVAGRLAALPRYEKSNVWARHGDRGPADSLARLCGTTKTAAHNELDTGQRLEGLAETSRAAREERLSPDQLREVAAGAAKAPEREADLLNTAETGTLRELREKSRQARFAGEDEAKRRERHRRHRHARHYRGPDGDGRILLSDAADVIAPLWALIQAAGKRRFEHARTNGEREPGCAYLADALEALIRRGARPTTSTGRVGTSGEAPGEEFLDDAAVTATVNVIVDWEAYQRGHAGAGETAVIDGAGPVSVEAIRDMARNGFITLSLFDGVDVHRVARPRPPLGPSPRQRTDGSPGSRNRRRRREDDRRQRAAHPGAPRDRADHPRFDLRRTGMRESPRARGRPHRSGRVGGQRSDHLRKPGPPLSPSPQPQNRTGPGEIRAPCRVAMAVQRALSAAAL